ncbi:MAG: CRTAC1 family protein [Gammaproteobacteria bacterium]|nr:CRTAC1 family protein [Gammaproteobacteria bacterium]
MYKTIITRSKILSATGFGFVALLFTGCQGLTESTAQPSKSSILAPPLFSATRGIMPLEDKPRRKWDNAVIADLDQDGRQDAILTEHGHRVRVFWNEGGTFSGPQDIAVGDLHGVAVSDFDRDGRTDVIIAQGGGDGNNPRRPLWFQVNKDRTFDGGKPFEYFEPGRGRAVKLLDADQDGAADLLLTGFPLPSQKAGANHFYENTGAGGFEFVGNLPQAKWLGYRALVTDFNSDHDPDFILYGGDNMVAVAGGEGMAFANVNAKVFGDLADTSHISSISEIDFDNDGDFDLFITRAEAQFEQETYYDEDSQRFAFLVFRQDYLFEDLEVEGDLQVDNLQVSYPHFDVFVGAEKRKLEFKGDRHGGKDFVLRQQDARGWPSGPLKAGLYIGYLGDGMWRVGGQSHSRTAAVFSNVVSRPKTVPQQPLPVRLLENRDGVFADVTARLGIAIDEQTTSAAVGDFDNNGWADLVVLRYGDMASQNEHIVYLNQGGKAFVRAANHGFFSPELGATGGSVEAFDFNLDGAVDLLFSNERGKWHLLENNSARQAAQGNFVIVHAGSSPSGQGLAESAEVTLKACGSTYRRKVGATSAAFAQGMNTSLHIGLGACQKVDGARIRWSNGESERFAVETLNTQVSAGRARQY